MNALTKRAPGGLPAAVSVPPPSHALAQLIRDVAAAPFNKFYVAGPTRARDDWFAVEMPAPELQAEAKELVRAITPLVAPAPLQLIRAWVVRLAAGVANAPDRQEKEPAIAAIALACADLPVACFTEETLAAALRQFRWWPAAAEVHELLWSTNLLWDNRLFAIQRIAHARPIAELEDARRRHAEARSNVGGWPS